MLIVSLTTLCLVSSCLAHLYQEEFSEEAFAKFTRDYLSPALRQSGVHMIPWRNVSTRKINDVSGLSLTMLCDQDVYRDNETGKILWYKDRRRMNEVLIRRETSNRVSVNIKKKLIFIKKLIESDTGLYTCVSGKNKTQLLHYEVQVDPATYTEFRHPATLMFWGTFFVVITFALINLMDIYARKQNL
ncbi:hypothetical protein HDE_07407 [Halotydeus destructor]|nr:hypothetical protein HDE_07407 [Halotydeus destructor]